MPVTQTWDVENRLTNWGWAVEESLGPDAENSVYNGDHLRVEAQEADAGALQPAYRFCWAGQNVLSPT